MRVEQGTERSHLRELISNFFNLLSLLADDCPMKLLLHDQVFGALVLLEAGENIKLNVYLLYD